MDGTQKRPLSPALPVKVESGLRGPNRLEWHEATFCKPHPPSGRSRRLPEQMPSTGPAGCGATPEAVRGPDLQLLPPSPPVTRKRVPLHFRAKCDPAVATQLQPKLAGRILAVE